MEIREEIIFLYSCQVGTFVKGLRSWHRKFHRNNLFESITQLGQATESSARTPHPLQLKSAAHRTNPSPQGLGKKGIILLQLPVEFLGETEQKNHSPCLRVNETPHQTFLSFPPKFLPLEGRFFSYSSLSWPLKFPPHTPNNFLSPSTWVPHSAKQYLPESNSEDVPSHMSL